MIDKKLVKKMRKRCLKHKDELPENWHRLKGVLVGISRCPYKDTTQVAIASWT